MNKTSSTPSLLDVISAVEAVVPPGLQESWDNTGWQIIPESTIVTCTGVLCCLDVTPAVISEAVSLGCNLVLSHHPLLFRGTKSVTPATPSGEALISAIRNGVAVYSCHTALDSSPCGPSAVLAARLGLVDTEILVPAKGNPSAGLGIVGNLPKPLTNDEFISLVLRVYGGFIRHTPGPGFAPVSRVALCSGSGGEFISQALDTDADAYITSDVRYHDFLDRAEELILVDTGHFESEICTKSIFSHIISEKFPNFAVRMCRCEHAPAQYAVNRQ